MGFPERQLMAARIFEKRKLVQNSTMIIDFLSRLNSYSSQSKSDLLMRSRQAELRFHKTNIGVFLKIATDCNFFLKKYYFYL